MHRGSGVAYAAPYLRVLIMAASVPPRMGVGFQIGYLGTTALFTATVAGMLTCVPQCHGGCLIRL
jgi:hypothetical protein